MYIYVYVGGWDAVEGPQLFEVPLGGTLMKQQVKIIIYSYILTVYSV
jgi:hypothetical protein